MPRQEIVGRDEIVGLEEIVGASLKDIAAAPLKLVKKAATLPFDAAEWALRRSPVPNKSWFIGKKEDEYFIGEDEYFIGEDDKILANEGSRSDASALARRAGTCGYNSHWAHIRGDGPGITQADLAKVKKLADGGNKKAMRLLGRLAKLAKADVSGDAGPKPDPENERREAKQILSAAQTAKSISRSALRRAIWLYAGKSSTEADRMAVGKKMIGLLNDRQVRLTN